MTTVEMRIAIAEHCGTLHDPPGHHGAYAVPKEVCVEYSPNYPEDLNAMHEAEKTLTLAQRHKYRNLLGDLCSQGLPVSQKHAAREAISATANQRSKSFVRAINKWKD